MAEYQIDVANGSRVTAHEGEKLVLALERNGVDISHRCGGNARCTSCRVEISGEEPPMGEAEEACLREDGVLGEFRLSCQIRVDRDLNVKVLQPVATAAWDNPGADVEP